MDSTKLSLEGKPFYSKSLPSSTTATVELRASGNHIRTIGMAIVIAHKISLSFTAAVLKV